VANCDAADILCDHGKSIIAMPRAEDAEGKRASQTGRKAREMPGRAADRLNRPISSTR